MLTPRTIEDEMAQGKVKIKENGIRKDHPEKEGVLVNLSDLVSEVRLRIQRKSQLDSLAIEAGGLRVVGGSKKEPDKTGDDVPEPGQPTEESIAAVPTS